MGRGGDGVLVMGRGGDGVLVMGRGTSDGEGR